MITIFKTAWRGILRNGVHSILNIVGFSTGLACFGLIMVWLSQQLSYDNFHKSGDRIFQVNARVENESSVWKEAVTPAPLAAALKAEFADVQHVLRLDVRDAVVKGTQETFKEDAIIAADPSFFTFFDLRLLKGNAVRALTQPYSVVLTESSAKKYFGTEDPINKSLRLFSYDPDGKGADYIVTGIIEDCPPNSHFTYTMVVSFSTIEVAEPETSTAKGWTHHEYYTYVMLNDKEAAAQVENNLSPIVKKHFNIPGQKDRYQYFLTPLRDIHFQSDIRAKIQAGVSRNYLLSFAAIGFVVLLFACINYVNLSTAFAVDRYKEVGIRKMLGSSRRRLVIQYLAQSWLMAMVALIVAFGWMEVAKPFFEAILESSLQGTYSFRVMGTLLFIASLAGILSGVYPAVLIASVQPVQILRGYFARGTSGMTVRKILVVVQYSVTVLLLIAVMTVSAQLKFIRDKDLGFNTENLIVAAMNGSPEAIPGYAGFYNELKSVQSVTGVARSNTSIGGGLSQESAVAQNSYDKPIDLHVKTVGVDHDYVNTYGISLVAGRDFIRGSVTDSSNFIVNEATTRALAFNEPVEALGKPFQIGDRKGVVVGVVRDFHHTSLHEQIEPMAMYLLPDYYSRISIGIAGNQQRALAAIEQAWKKNFPSTVFDYAFADDKVSHSYRMEDRFAKLYFIFSVISIVIASLGLFALISYSVQRRTKEIGIRKVHGASVAQISMLMSKDFIVLVVIACCISMPLGWYAMKDWLQNFAYHINPGLTFILGSSFVTVILAVATVATRAIQSATANPVTSLRTE